MAVDVFEALAHHALNDRSEILPLPSYAPPPFESPVYTRLLQDNLLRDESPKDDSRNDQLRKEESLAGGVEPEDFLVENVDSARQKELLMQAASERLKAGGSFFEFTDPSFVAEDGHRTILGTTQETVLMFPPKVHSQLSVDSKGLPASEFKRARTETSPATIELTSVQRKVKTSAADLPPSPAVASPSHPQRAQQERQVLSVFLVEDDPLQNGEQEYRAAPMPLSPAKTVLSHNDQLDNEQLDNDQPQNDQPKRDPARKYASEDASIVPVSIEESAPKNVYEHVRRAVDSAPNFQRQAIVQAQSVPTLVGLSITGSEHGPKSSILRDASPATGFQSEVERLPETALAHREASAAAEANQSNSPAATPQRIAANIFAASSAPNKSDSQRNRIQRGRAVNHHGEIQPAFGAVKTNRVIAQTVLRRGTVTNQSFLPVPDTAALRPAKAAAFKDQSPVLLPLHEIETHNLAVQSSVMRSPVLQRKIDRKPPSDAKARQRKKDSVRIKNYVCGAERSTGNELPTTSSVVLTETHSTEQKEIVHPSVALVGSIQRKTNSSNERAKMINAALPQRPRRADSLLTKKQVQTVTGFADHMVTPSPTETDIASATMRNDSRTPRTTEEELRVSKPIAAPRPVSAMGASATMQRKVAPESATVPSVKTIDKNHSVDTEAIGSVITQLSDRGQGNFQLRKAVQRNPLYSTNALSIFHDSLETKVTHQVRQDQDTKDQNEISLPLQQRATAVQRHSPGTNHYDLLPEVPGGVDRTLPLLSAITKPPTKLPVISATSPAPELSEARQPARVKSRTQERSAHESPAPSMIAETRTESVARPGGLPERRNPMPRVQKKSDMPGVNPQKNFVATSEHSGGSNLLHTNTIYPVQNEPGAIHQREISKHAWTPPRSSALKDTSQVNATNLVEASLPQQVVASSNSLTTRRNNNNNEEAETRRIVEPVASPASRLPVAALKSSQKSVPHDTSKAGNAETPLASITSYLARYSPAPGLPGAKKNVRGDSTGTTRGTRSEASASRSIKIHIGRIHVDGSTALSTPRAKFVRPRPTLGLQQYMQTRRGSAP